MKSTEHISLLHQLRLPTRYEVLAGKLGADVANILVPPGSHTVEQLARLTDGVRAQSEGVLVPLHGQSGIGKSTFASSVNQWAPSDYTPSVIFDGPIEYEALVSKTKKFRELSEPGDDRILPIVIDHREAAPPDEREMSAIKRFLRSSGGHGTSVIFWPDVNKDIAASIADRFVKIAGPQPIDLPLSVEGPARDSWREIAYDTLRLANDFDSLDKLGVDPSDYDPSQYRTIGNFLRAISKDFQKLLQELRRGIAKDLEIVILFASESSTPGVLSQLTSASRYGVVDGAALVAATPGSVVGRWWKNRPGLLTRVIVQLNVRAVCLPPVTSMSAIRNIGPVDFDLFNTIRMKRVGASRAIRDIGRADIGKILTDEKLARFENRGKPAVESLEAFRALAERGLGGGKDKQLNDIMTNAFGAFLEHKEIVYRSARSETALEFAALIPDTQIEFDDRILCIEYAWRSGDYLKSKRSTVAEYVLKKLQNYARELGWADQ